MDLDPDGVVLTDNLRGFQFPDRNSVDLDDSTIDADLQAKLKFQFLDRNSVDLDVMAVGLMWMYYKVSIP